MQKLRQVALPTLRDTEEEAAILALIVQPGDLLLLHGELGVGKTAFVRALLRVLAKDATLVVPSPTFNLVHVFETPTGLIWHGDLYRLTSTEEVQELGLEEAFLKDICLIEWPDSLKPFWYAQGMKLHFSMDKQTGERTLFYLAEQGEWARRLAFLNRA